MSDRAAACAALTDRFTAAGWTSVTVKPIGRFISISATDPGGSAHAGAREDGEPLAEYLLAIGLKAGMPLPPLNQPMVSDALRALMHDQESIADARTRLTAELRTEYSDVNNLNQYGAGGRVWNETTGKTVAERFSELSALFDELARLGDARPANG